MWNNLAISKTNFTSFDYAWGKIVSALKQASTSISSSQVSWSDVVNVNLLISPRNAWSGSAKSSLLGERSNQIFNGEPCF